MTTSRVYDTCFFVEYSIHLKELVGKLKEEFRSKNEKMVSSLIIHEFHRIVLKTKGKEVAALRSGTIQRDFQVVFVDYLIAVKSAELRAKHPNAHDTQSNSHNRPNQRVPSFFG